MTVTKKILIGVAALATVIFGVSTKKIGPCSPELDELSYAKYNPKKGEPAEKCND